MSFDGDVCQLVEIGTPSIEKVRTRKKLESLQQKMGYRFQANEHLLKKALEHSSSSNQKEKDLSSETLEFLGDAVLYLVITKKLVSDQPWQGEGALTELRKNLIKNSTLVRVGDRLGLRNGEYLLVGKSVKEGTGVTDRMVANAVEAIIGAIYRSDGERLDAVDVFVDRWFFRSGIMNEVQNEIDGTSRLKEWCEKNKLEWPKEIHCQNKDDGTWSCRLTISIYDGVGEGRTKSIAKGQAAFKILQKIESSAPA